VERRRIPAGSGDGGEPKRPIVIVDPRAGHGPGIGGSKRDSEVGNALNEGHPVYFVIFYTEPVPGQTLDDVQKAEAAFIEEVRRRHPDAEEPSVIGNCQAGWASALLGAERPESIGPLVLNGAPLSFWSGVRGKAPLRYRAGLCGGVWLVSLLSDLGNGVFDGANLVAGFEDLNPANTLWTKQYNVFANVDTEEERYLGFEKWWGAFFLFSREEIHEIVNDLFVGDELEMGSLELYRNRKVDLRDIEEPVLVFASRGDNITPPQQALDWIRTVYGSEEEIKRQQRVVVYMVHPRVGHLGIFVSRSVAAREHRAIIQDIDLMDYLPPGLYEMVIEEAGERMGVPEYRARFEARSIDDLKSVSGQGGSEPEFRTVAAVSRLNDRLYQLYASPWIRMGSTDLSAELIRQLHPLRIQRYGLSDMNPAMLPAKLAASAVRQERRPSSPGNPWLAWEQGVSALMETWLGLCREIRDRSQELLFEAVYGNPCMQSLFLARGENRDGPGETVASGEETSEDVKYWMLRMSKGGFAEAVVRIMVCIMDADRLVHRCELESFRNIASGLDALCQMDTQELRQMIRDQSCILCTDEECALNGLRTLLPTEEERMEAVRIARRMAFADQELSEEEERALERIESALGIPGGKASEGVSP
jgi:pimeloyl-ACP methyl ester carboxylesterase/uncharacterized tellurite resistance protein B-like protein